jgi:hypothetical protein
MAEAQILLLFVKPSWTIKSEKIKKKCILKKILLLLEKRASENTGLLMYIFNGNYEINIQNKIHMAEMARLNHFTIKSCQFTFLSGVHQESVWMSWMG